MRKRNFLVAAGACLAALTLAAPLALADPTGNPPTRVLAGGGSDTTQDVMNALSNIPASGSRVIGSYDASGSATLPATKIAIPGSDCTGIPRPVGSTNGVRALVAQRAAAAADPPRRPCLDFARSSSDSSQNAEFAGTGLSYVVLATDTLSWASRRDSLIPATLTAAQLRAIYECTAPGTISNPPTILPLLPQAGSGTRTDWLRFLGLPGAPVVPGPCVSDRDPTNPAIGLIENTGNRLTDPRQLVPMSKAQWHSQLFRIIPDVRGASELRRVNGFSPISISFPFRREVFDVVPTSELGDPTVSATFIGPNSAICNDAADAVVSANSFSPSPDCGTIRSQTPGGPGVSLPGPVN